MRPSTIVPETIHKATEYKRRLTHEISSLSSFAKESINCEMQQKPSRLAEGSIFAGGAAYQPGGQKSQNFAICNKNLLLTVLTSLRRSQTYPGKLSMETPMGLKLGCDVEVHPTHPCGRTSGFACTRGSSSLLMHSGN